MRVGDVSERPAWGTVEFAAESPTRTTTLSALVPVGIIAALNLPFFLIGLLGCLSLFGGFYGAPMLAFSAPLLIRGMQILGGTRPLQPWYARLAMGAAAFVASIVWFLSWMLRGGTFPIVILVVPAVWSVVVFLCAAVLDRHRP